MKMLRGLLVVAGFCVLGKLVGQEATIEALKTANGGVVVDGNLNDDIWWQGEWKKGFTFLGKAGKQLSAQTFFKVAYDENYLYFAAKLEEPSINNLRIDEFHMDGFIQGDDAIELLMDPYGDQEDHYVFGVNAIGTKFDEHRSLGGLLYDLDWNAEWKVATKIGLRDWTVEMAIPFAELGLDERSLGNWRLNVVRHQYAGGRNECASYVAVVESFNEPENFAELKFPIGVFEKYLWKVGGPCECFLKAHLSKGWTEWLGGNFWLHSKGNGVGEFKLIFKQLAKRSKPLIGFGDGKGWDKEHQRCEFFMPVQKETPLKLRIEFVNATNPQDILWVENCTLNIEPIELSFIDPSYRNTIYGTQNLSEIKVNIKISEAPEILEKGALRLQLLSENGEKVFYETLVQQVTCSNNSTLPAKNLLPGNYWVRAELLSLDGKAIHSTEKTIKKLKAVPYEWRVDADGNLIKNGKQVIPIGLFQAGLETLKEYSGDYLAIFQSEENVLNQADAEMYLHKLEKTGTYAIMYPYPEVSYLVPAGSFYQSLLNKEEAEIRKYVQSLKRYPALMAWVLAFLPDSESIPAKRLKRIYEIVAEEDPYHPCIVVISSNRSIQEYSGTADILMPFTKLAFLKEKGPSRPLGLIARQFDLANHLKKQGETFWTCLQAYNHDLPDETPTRIPNLVESRNMLYQSVIKGAKGFFWYPLDTLKNIPLLVQELRLLEKAILAPNLPIEQEADLAKDKTILSMLKKVEEDYFLFLVNLVEEKKEFHLKMPELREQKVLYVVSEGREVNLTSEGVLKDTLDAYGVHIYSTKPVRGNVILSDGKVEK